MESPRTAVERPESRLLSGLSSAERARIGPYLHAVPLTLRQNLARTGDPITQVLFPTDAVASTVMFLPEGDTVEVGLTGAEGIVGFQLLYGERISTVDVLVQVQGSGKRMAADDFL